MAGVFVNQLLLHVSNHHVIIKGGLNHFNQLLAVKVCPDIRTLVSHGISFLPVYYAHGLAVGSLDQVRIHLML